MKTRPYVVISPVRNEADHLAATIDSLANQSILPVLWVVVDDGSTDETGRIADAAAATHDWIRVVHRPNRGFRQAGGGVMEAFYDGLSLVADDSWEYLVKLDGDLSFTANYFQQCFERFEQEPKLGIGGGTVCCLANGVLECESKSDPVFHVRGATKIYRRNCWRDLGGLILAPGWDTIDEVKANMLGWRTMTFSDIRLRHLRPTGKAYGAWNDLIKHGRANYIAGYHPLFMIAKCFKRLLGRPILIHSLGLFTGFFTSYFSNVQQISDRDLIRYLRKQQLRRLVGLPSIWR